MLVTPDPEIHAVLFFSVSQTEGTVKVEPKTKEDP
jgi:hypothetical protein